MNTLLWCLLAAVLMPYLAKIPLVVITVHERGRYDNRDPRGQASQLTGAGARARAAHENSFEALLVFATCALAALATGRADEHSGRLGMLFLAARAFYVALYLMDFATARSLSWTVGYLCCLALLLQVLL